MRAIFVAALLWSSSAPALELRDGARLRRIERLGRVDGKLQAVRWSDVGTGRAAPAFIGRRAIVRGDAAGARVVRELPAGYRLVEHDGEDGLELAARLGGIPDLYFRRKPAAFQTPPDDPRYPGQWFFQKIGIEAAWKLETGRPEVVIAVIDNGCDPAQPDLVDKLLPGRDAVNGTGDPAFAPNVKGNFHGTACAGLVAASTNNDVGVAGACPGCKLRCVRLLDENNGNLVPISADMDAFQFALDSGAAVASNSWGFVDPTPVPQPLADAIALFHDQARNGLGGLVVFAAGNDNRALDGDELESLPTVFTVGAVNNFDEVAQFSNFGAGVSLVAPTGTLTTDISGADGNDPGDYTSAFGGTSSACPIVAGLFGLMVSAAPTKKASELESILRMTAKQSIFAQPNAMGHDDYYGYGLVQPAAALAMLQEKPKPPPSGGCDIGGRPAPGAWWLLLVALLISGSRTGNARGPSSSSASRCGRGRRT